MNLPPFEWGRRWHQPLAGGWVYLRHSNRPHPDRSGRVLACLDIANAELPEEDRGKGYFTLHLCVLEEFVRFAPDFDAIYCENVMNERLPAFFKLRGYIQTNPGKYPPNFIYMP